jgi:hypothetical protein
MLTDVQYGHSHGSVTSIVQVASRLLSGGLQGTPRTWARGWRASTSARGG